ncbi:MAG: hypothetical protein H6543_01675 [Prevotellaceae bacterium]|nr:hypothetical protein [Prevotellaceae bacterium]
MKRYLLFISLFILSIGFVNAQQRGCNNARREAMEAQKVAFITEKVGLTPEEAEKFWPLYNSFEAQRRDLRHQMHEIRRNITSDSNEEDYKKALNELQKIDMQQSALKLKYHKEFLKILSAKKLFNYYSAENEYKKELIKHIEQGCRR